MEIKNFQNSPFTPEFPFLQVSLINLSRPPNGLTPEQIFKIYDQTGDGFISADDMKKLMMTFGKNISEAEVNEFMEDMKKADKDGDNLVSLEEFKACLEKQKIK